MDVSESQLFPGSNNGNGVGGHYADGGMQFPISELSREDLRRGEHRYFAGGRRIYERDAAAPSQCMVDERKHGIVYQVESHLKVCSLEEAR